MKYLAHSSVGLNGERALFIESEKKKEEGNDRPTSAFDLLIQRKTMEETVVSVDVEVLTRGKLWGRFSNF